MSFYKTYKTNGANETDGIVLDYGDSGKIRIARAGGSNRKYTEQLRLKLLKPYERQIANNTMDEEASTRIFAEIYASTIILGWEGVSDENGKPLAFTRDNVIKLLTDLPELFRDIQDAAQKFSNFREAELDEERKN